jgi:hypothetical protein
MSFEVSQAIAHASARHHPSIQEAAKYFTRGKHLPEGQLRDISELFHELAVELLNMPGLEGPQLTIALNKLMESKDYAIRAAL